MLFENEKTFVKEFTLRAHEKFAHDPNEMDKLEAYDILATMLKDYMTLEKLNCRKAITKQGTKQLIYFSMEFLIGRLLEDNLVNLGIYDIVENGLKKLGFNLKDIASQEPDAGLGNGGLGRLAACFLDSIASDGYVGHGNCIRYDYGFFRQKISKNGEQEEYPDQWLLNGCAWESRKPQLKQTVKFYGNEETYTDENGNLKRRTSNAINVYAIPCDISIPGYKNGVINNLRLWTAEPCIETLPKGVSFTEYLDFCRNITHGLYPDDRTEQGKLLRLRQQYFLVSAGLQSTLESHFRVYKTFDNLPDHYVFHLNDTHPILAIPEMMRLLMDEHSYTWEKAYEITSKCFAFTNHTVMPEALEKWPTQYLSSLFPRVYMIIEEINRRLLKSFRENNVPNEVIENSIVIKDGMVRMCQLAINVCFSVNGVASLHTEILKAQTFKDLYSLYPYKFNNKTNGISHRRFLLVANPELSKFITSLIGDKWIIDPEKELKKLLAYKDDELVLKRLLEIKTHNKLALKELVKSQYGNIELDTNSIIDCQIKRLHAYKRQLMNVFRIIYLAFKIKHDNEFKIHPTTFIFGAKAAPSYTLAKKIIELINAVAKFVNSDVQVSKYLKVFFIENYDVSKAMVIIPASDVSEQISLAGKEASGTSNMKFMMNGAITLGTLDGANVEINDLVGSSNDVIFGLKAQEADKLRYENTYNPWDIYNSDIEIKTIVDSLIDGTFDPDKERFRMIFDEVMFRRDEYFILKDLRPYIEATYKTYELYQDKLTWAKMCLINIASSGFFTSDRTIEQYNKDVWHLQKLDLKK